MGGACSGRGQRGLLQWSTERLGLRPGGSVDTGEDQILGLSRTCCGTSEEEV